MVESHTTNKYKSFTQLLLNPLLTNINFLNTSIINTSKSNVLVIFIINSVCLLSVIQLVSQLSFKKNEAIVGSAITKIREIIIIK